MKILYLLLITNFPLFSMNNENNEQSLIDAIHLNEPSTIQALIGKKVNVSFHQNKPIIEACKLGRAEIAQILIDHGADIQDQNNCALLNACTHGHEQCVQLLIKYHADIDCKDGRPVEVTIQKSYLSLVSMLIRAGCKLQKKHFEAAKKRNALEKNGSQPTVSSSYKILKIIEFCLADAAREYMKIFDKTIQQALNITPDTEKQIAQAAIMLHDDASFDTWLTHKEFRTISKLYGLFVYACVYHNYHAVSKLIDAVETLDNKDTKNIKCDMILYGLRHQKTLPSHISYYLVSTLAQELAPH